MKFARVGGLTKIIDDILNGDWKPSGKEHVQIIYYVSGFVIRKIHNRAKVPEEKLACVLRQLEKNITSSSEHAAIEGLPIGKVERMKALGLFCPTCEFYDVMTTVEAVFDNI